MKNFIIRSKKYIKFKNPLIQLINTNIRKTKLMIHLIIINKTSNIKQFNHLNSLQKREKIKDINKRIDLKK